MFQISLKCLIDWPGLMKYLPLVLHPYINHHEKLSSRYILIIVTAGICPLNTGWVSVFGATDGAGGAELYLCWRQSNGQAKISSVASQHNNSQWTSHKRFVSLYKNWYDWRRCIWKSLWYHLSCRSDFHLCHKDCVLDLVQKTSFCIIFWIFFTLIIEVYWEGVTEKLNKIQYTNFNCC